VVQPVEAGELGAPEPPGTEAPKRSNLLAVVLWMTGTLLAFSLMAISVRQLGGVLNLFELLMARSFGGLLILLVVMAMRPAMFRDLKPRRPGIHLFRSGAHFLANIAWANAVITLPLATVFAIEFMMPVWAGVLAVIFLGERFTVSRAGSIALGFLGVLVILRPGIEAFQPAALGVLAASFGYAIANITMKQLVTVQPPITILFWMSVIQSVMALPGIDPHDALRLTSVQWMWAAGIAFGGTAAHYCIANAMRAGDAIVVIPLDFLRIPLIALVGWLFYAERIDVVVFVGAGVIVTGLIWNLRAEMRR
jgi:drug/metabolite transporter (DMT)-like permease